MAAVHPATEVILSVIADMRLGLPDDAHLPIADRILDALIKAGHVARPLERRAPEVIIQLTRRAHSDTHPDMVYELDAAHTSFSHDLPIMGWESTRWRIRGELGWTTDQGVFSIDRYARVMG